MKNKLLTENELNNVNGGMVQTIDSEIPSGREISFNEIDETYKGKHFYVLNANDRSEWAFCELVGLNPLGLGGYFKSIRTKENKTYSFSKTGSIRKNSKFITTETLAVLLLTD